MAKDEPIESLEPKKSAWPTPGVLQLWDPFVSYIRQGADPPVLARSFAVGLCMGCCPLMGISFALCVAVIAACKFLHYPLHTPMTVLANTVAIPFELLLVLPFMRLGEFLLRAENLDVKPSAFLDLFKHPGKGLLAVGHALFAWVILLIPAIVLMSFALQPVFAEIKKRLPAAEEGEPLDDDVETRLISGQADRFSDTGFDSPARVSAPEKTSVRPLLSAQGAVSSAVGASASGTVSPRAAARQQQGESTSDVRQLQQGAGGAFKASGAGQGMNAFLPARRNANVELGTARRNS